MKITIIGAGNLGTAIARGLVDSGSFLPADVTLTRRKVEKLDAMQADGFVVTGNNRDAVSGADVVIVSVEPQQINSVLEEIKSVLCQNQLLISVATGVTICRIEEMVASSGVTVLRAMPNTAVSVRESMTCIACNDADTDSLRITEQIFNTVGITLVIDEALMSAATALAACGTAFFLRAVRAASQGGIEIGFASKDAIKMAAQTAKGAATLLLRSGNHPELEIDRVTTPLGCTIAGLNRMEHEGFSSAMIEGITTSAEKAKTLYQK